jgi:hypothetical protein
MSALDKRKHRKQMTKAEIIAVEDVVQAQPNWVLGPHAIARLEKKGITKEQVLETLKIGYVIEVNRNNDLCVAFRKEYGAFAVCVVVSLQTRWVVTAWKNSAKDKHRRLDFSNYRWGVDLTREMEAFA